MEKIINVQLIKNGIIWSEFGTNEKSFEILCKQNTDKRFYRLKQLKTI